VAGDNDQIVMQKNGHPAIVKQNGKSRVTNLELQKNEAGNYYSVTSAFIDTANWSKRSGRVILWERRRPLPNSPEQMLALASLNPETEAQVGKVWGSGQSGVDTIAKKWGKSIFKKTSLIVPNPD
jgi:hypothetical protein